MAVISTELVRVRALPVFNGAGRASSNYSRAAGGSSER
jgi:hypothetical protein